MPAMPKYLVVLSLLVGLAAVAMAAPVDNRDLITLGPLYGLEDKDDSLSAADIFDPHQNLDFVKLDTTRPNFGMSASAFWIRTTLPPLPNAGDDWLIKFAVPLLDEAEIYYRLSDGRILQFRSGDMMAFDERPTGYRHITFPVPSAAAHGAEIILRAKGEGVLVLPLELWREDTYRTHELPRQIFTAGYVGFAVAIIFLTGIVYLYLRDPTHLWYVLYIANLVLLIAATTGYGPQVIWPHFAGLSNVVLVIAFGGTVAFGLGFTRNFLRAGAHIPKYDLALQSCQWGGFAVMILAPLVPYRPLVGFSVALALTTLFVTLMTVMSAVRQGYRPARFMAAGFAALGPGFIILLARSYGFLPDGLIAEYGVEVSTAFEMVFLTAALATRARALEELSYAAERRIHRTREEYAQRLIEMQENERRRIAGELHDSVGQTLLYITNTVKRLEDGAMGESISNAAQAATDEVRAIAHDLHPHQLDRLGLKAALHDMIDKAFEPTDILVKKELQALDLLPKDARRIHIFRCVQEAVSNVIRHADAERCDILVARDKDFITISVRDDGSGGKTGHRGFGLENMSERMRLIGGNFSFITVDDGGVIVEFSLPIETPVERKIDASS